METTRYDGTKTLTQHPDLESALEAANEAVKDEQVATTKVIKPHRFTPKSRRGKKAVGGRCRVCGYYADEPPHGPTE